MVSPRAPAEHFFNRLSYARIARLLDVRLKNTSQLAGFAEAQDLSYFLRELAGVTYTHEPRLAPTQDLIDQRRTGSIDWDTYERRFLGLMRQRRVEKILPAAGFRSPTALLSGEPGAEHSHRRLVCEYLQARWPAVRVVHL